jgi:acyl-CoA thioesterase
MPEQPDGVAKLREMAKVEPIARFFDFKVLELGPGYAKASMQMKPEYLNVNGMVFGGIIMSIADQVFGLAVNTIAHPSIAGQFNIYFLARVEPRDELVGECRMIKNGKRLGVSEITVTNQRGEVVARATGTTIPVGKGTRVP